MTTTLQEIQDRAVAFSVANGIASLVSDRAEIIKRIKDDQLTVFQLAAKHNRYYFAVAVPVNSNAAAADRVIEMSALNPPVNRILKFKLADGRDVNQVDLLDLEGELSPRYYVLGTAIYEVSSDWSAGAAAVVSGTLYYMKGPAVLNVAGDLAQVLTLPDEFTQLLELRLARYLANKDVGREASELEELASLIAAADTAFISHITEFGGVTSRRFDQPQPVDK